MSQKSSDSELSSEDEFGDYSGYAQLPSDPNSQSLNEFNDPDTNNQDANNQETNNPVTNNSKANHKTNQSRHTLTTTNSSENISSTSCTITTGHSNFSSKYTDNRPESSKNQQNPYQVQQLFTKALELPPRPAEDELEFPDPVKPEIDVVTIKNVMKNVSLPPIELSSVSSLSTKMKNLSDEDFRKVMLGMLSSKNKKSSNNDVVKLKPEV